MSRTADTAPSVRFNGMDFLPVVDDDNPSLDCRSDAPPVMQL